MKGIDNVGKEVKMCKTCGKEKPIKEFHKNKVHCKLCIWLGNKQNQNKIDNILSSNPNWNKEELIVLIDNILSFDICIVNDLIDKLNNKDLDDIISITSQLKIKGKNIRVKYNCEVCGKEHFDIISSYKKSKYHFCCNECHSIFMRNDYNVKEGYSVCNFCKKEKPVKEFIKTKSHGKIRYTRCKVCDFYSRNPNINIPTLWSKNELDIVLDLLLNKKIDYINNILPYLNNKNIDDLLQLLDKIKLGGQTKIRIGVNCGCCDKMFGIKPYLYKEKRKNYFCSKECSAKYHGKLRSKNKTTYTKICQYCGKQFIVDKSRETQGKNKFCSPECSQKSRIQRIKVECSYCGKEKYVVPSKYKTQEKYFCDSNCENKFRSEQAREIRKCEFCNNDYETFKNSNQRFCSTDCQIEWQKTITGVDNPCFTSELIKCDWCGKEYYERQYVLNSNQENHFCSIECRQAWFSNVFSQSEEFKEFSRIKAVNMLASGDFNHTNTEPQIKLNDILNSLNIKYINEYNCKYVAIDNYLPEHNLMIECMGGFWHCDNRFYNKVNYVNQKERIKQDKIKKSYIKSQYNINILYLWEDDILNNSEICNKLIIKYVSNKGILVNYHSFNYNIYNNELALSKNLIIPYMDWSANELNEIVDIKVKEKTSRKQPEKWIIFNCENCGKETEQLISKHKKAKHHFCSIKCSSEYRVKQNRINKQKIS